MAQSIRPLRSAQGDFVSKKAFGNGTAKLIIALVVLGLGIGGGIYFGLRELTPADTPRSKSAVAPGPIQEFDSVVVNVAGTNGERYLKAAVALELTTPQAKRELEVRKAEARDIIISQLSSMPLGKLQIEKGRDELKQGIQRAINDLLMQGKVERVYFTEFVIQ
ncbi:MAG TPA: hypothetical protein GX509_01920 [Firmicutes bacterium]|nr:hypothetical protein [Bacillota bacterium]